MARAGQGLVEYVLLIALIAILLIASLAFLRRSVETQIDEVPELSDCLTPGQGGVAPGQGGVAPGQCKKDSTSNGKANKGGKP